LPWDIQLVPYVLRDDSKTFIDCRRRIVVVVRRVGIVYYQLQIWFMGNLLGRRYELTSVALGEFSMSSSTFSTTLMTFASKFASSVAIETNGFFTFQIGDAVIPNILGLEEARLTSKYSRMIPLYG
jgi:hypothetical protein